VGWFWWNVPLMVVFFGCWTGIPLWLTLTRWNAEVSAKHAEIAAAQADVAPRVIAVQLTEGVAQGTPAFAGVADQLEPLIRSERRRFASPLLPP
jgi:hypothetical protein